MVGVLGHGCPSMGLLESRATAYAGRLQPRNDLLGLLELEVFRKGPLLRIVASFSPWYRPPWMRRQARLRGAQLASFPASITGGVGAWHVDRRRTGPPAPGVWNVVLETKLVSRHEERPRANADNPRTNAHAPSTNTDGPSR